MSEERISALEKQVAQLSSVVEKQSALISKTGQQLMEIQVKNVKSKMNDIDSKPNIDLSDYVTNEDIVQLVGELQTQLDFLEDRTINRLLNSKITDHKQPLLPICNKDGEITDLYPSTYGEFCGLDKADTLSLAEFYELAGPDEESLKQLLNDDTLKTLAEAEALAQAKATPTTKLESLTEEAAQSLKQDLAKYLGLINYSS